MEPLILPGSELAGARVLIAVPHMPQGQGTLLTEGRQKLTGEKCWRVLLDTGVRLQCVTSDRMKSLPALKLSNLLHERSYSGKSSGVSPRCISCDTQELPAYLDVPRFKPPRHDGRLPSLPGAAAPVMPTLFLPGFPKSGTTWLYECLLSAFSPAGVGCGSDAMGWNVTRCGKRFLLPVLRARNWWDKQLQLETNKEPFFFGGERGLGKFRADLMKLHGPNPRLASTSDVSLPPLWPWDVFNRMTAWRRDLHRARHNSSLYEVSLARERWLLERMDAMCQHSTAIPQQCFGLGPPAQKSSSRQGRRGRRSTVEEPDCGRQRCSEAGMGSRPAEVEASQAAAAVFGVQRRRSRSAAGEAPAARLLRPLHGRKLHGLSAQQLRALPSPRGVPLDDCTHPACTRAVRAFPKSCGLGCGWQPHFEKLGRTDAYCVDSMLPWARSGELELVVGDFTPNYLCDAKAMERLAGLPSAPHLRFIVVMREPIARAFSEWTMFTLTWDWEKITHFHSSLTVRVKQFRDCNQTLFANPRLLKDLPTAELATYLKRCWVSGATMMYPQGSMYSVCLLHALRLFPREQFLFLRYEDANRMPRPKLLELLGSFSGLSVGPSVLERSTKCSPSSKRRSTYSKLSEREKALYNLSLPLARDNSPLPPVIYPPKTGQSVAGVVGGNYAIAGSAGRPSSGVSLHAQRREEYREMLELFLPYNDLLADLIHPEFGWDYS